MPAVDDFGLELWVRQILRFTLAELRHTIGKLLVIGDERFPQRPLLTLDEADPNAGYAKQLDSWARPVQQILDSIRMTQGRDGRSQGARLDKLAREGAQLVRRQPQLFTERG